MNAAPRLNDEVCKRSQVGPSNSWAAAKARSLPAAVVMCLAIFLATMRMFGGAVEQAPADDGTGNSPVAPVIAAKPEHVTVAGGRGSTEIQWDTGNGLIGFVFVTEKDRKPVLFATGMKGSRVAPWIRARSYVFELYNDAERRTLLATVTVSGTAKSEASPRAMLLQGTARCISPFTSARQERCARHFLPSQRRRRAPCTLHETFCLAWPPSFVWMASSFIPDCMSRC